MTEYTVTDTAPYLTAERTEGTWNGFPVPVATADAFVAYMAALREGEGGEVEPFPHDFMITVREGDGALVYEDVDGVEEWVPVGVDESGARLYALDGWTWTERADA